MYKTVSLLIFALVVSPLWAANSALPPSDPQALAFAAASISALTGGTTIGDATLTGSVTWTAGSDSETGTATLEALGTGESRIDLALTTGTRTEIRDAQTGPERPAAKTMYRCRRVGGCIAGHHCRGGRSVDATLARRF